MIRVLVRVRTWDRVRVRVRVIVTVRVHSSVTYRFFSGNWTTTHPPRNANNVEPYTFVTLLP